MSRFAVKTGLNRSHLYRALQVGGNPSLDLIMRVCEEMRLVIQVVPKSNVKREIKVQQLRGLRVHHSLVELL